MEVRRERNRILRELWERKNLEFRRSLVGETLSAVTLEQRGMALTTNFLKVELAEAQPANRMVAVHIGGLNGANLREAVLLPVLR